MNLLRHLLAKDLRRAWRSPWRWLIHLSLPLALTGLLGLAFGRRASDTARIERIKIALVDEDDSILTQFLRGAFNQGEAAKHLEVIQAGRDEAVQLIRKDKLSAVFIVPKGFTADYLSGRDTKPLELIKNPAQTIYPALVEEGIGVAVTALNAFSKALGPVLPIVQAMFNSDEPPDFHGISRLIESIGERVDKVRPILTKPLVFYEKEVRKKEGQTRGPAFNLFAFLLPGMASAFLLYLADQASRDLFKEQTGHTLHRFSTLHHGLGPVIFGKVLLAVVIVWLGGAILFGGGGLLFGIRWERPVPMAALIAAYGFMAAGLLSLVTALAATERRANALNNVLVMGMAFVGGSYFPARQLPEFLQDHVSPWLPNFWFIEAFRRLGAQGGQEWVPAAFKLVLLGVLCAVAASLLLQRRMEKGVRP